MSDTHSAKPDGGAPAAEESSVSKAPEQDAQNSEPHSDGTGKQQAQMDALLARMDSVENLLQLQHAQSKKVAFHRAIQSFLLLCLVVVFGVGLYSLNVTVQTATRDIPELVDNANQMVEQTGGQLGEILTDIQKIDFDKLNESITNLEEGIDKMDFDGLNESIQQLGEVIETLSDLTRIFR